VALAYDIRGSAQQGAIASPITMAQLIPASPMAQRQPDFVLDTAEHVFNPNENDPSRKRFAWGGADDLSARIWLGVDGDDLVVRVDVRDDRHVQPNPAPEMWKADSVQFVLAPSQLQGHWEVGLAADESGQPLAHVWNSPSGHELTGEQIRLEVQRIDSGHRFTARLPLDAMDTTADALRKQSVRFNLLVNDDDLGKREGWIHVAPNLGRNRDVASFPVIRFE
jgi:hypothetical protein